MALDDDNGQSVLFVAGHNNFIHFPNTYEGEVCNFFLMCKPFLLSQAIMHSKKMVLYSTKSGSLARNNRGTTFGAV